MPKALRGTERREDALSRERIVEAAIALLDDEGEDGLTFRALASRLSTGPGAIYWHIANKSELLVAASDAMVSRALGDVPVALPHDAIRRTASVVFEVVDAHPWVGAQLSRAPWQAGTLQIFENIGRELWVLGVPRAAQFTSASTLLSYIIGVSVQNAANGRQFDPPVDRAEFLETVATEWEQLDAREYTFTREAAAELRVHDDRAEFLAGIDLIVAGIGSPLASRAAAPRRPPRAKIQSRR